MVLLTAFATAVPLVKRPDWWIRSFEFPRLQIAFFGILAIILFAGAFRVGIFDFVILFTGIFAVGWQIYFIFPYTPLASKEVISASNPEAKNTFNLLLANVLMSNRCSQDLLDVIKFINPDLILLLEPDQWWQHRLTELENTYFYRLACAKSNRYGMLLYSRLELIDPKIRYLVEEDIPSMHAEVLLPSGTRVELHCLHPPPPSPTENDTSLERDAELLIAGKMVGNRNRPVIVAGDLNDVAWSRTTRRFQKISRLLDPRVGRGLFNTYHAKYWFMRWPLDHLFHSEDFTLVSIERLPYFGSDHFPINVVLHYEPRLKARQPLPHASAEDYVDANQKIAAKKPSATKPYSMAYFASYFGQHLRCYKSTR